MSEPDDNATPPVLPPNSMQPPQRSGIGRRVFLFIFILVTGLFILGGWVLVSSFGEFADTMMAPPTNQYAEVTLRVGDSDERIAVIDVNGIITSYGALGDNMVNRIKNQLDLAGADSHIKAVLLRIDSPGGEVLASDEIALAITEFQKEHDKPVIASMGGLAASGGYYVAAPCKFIVANELTITGSIGVIMQSINMHGLMEKVGVRPVTFKSGKNKDMLSPFNSPESVSEEQKAILQGFIDETYGKFVKVVEDGRQKNGGRDTELAKELDSNWRDAADGRILSGKQAFDLGMVDKLGNFDVAVAFAEEYVGIKGKARLVQHEPPFNFGGLFGLLGKAKAKDPGVSLKIDVGLSAPQLKPGLPYYLSSHLYSE